MTARSSGPSGLLPLPGCSPSGQQAGQVGRDAPDVLAPDEQRRHRQLDGQRAVVDGRRAAVDVLKARSGGERGEAAGEGAGGAGRGDVQGVPARVQVSRARGLHAGGDLHVRGDEPGVEQAARHRVDQLVGQRDLALARDQLGEVRVPACVPLGRQRQDASRVPGRVAQADRGVDHVEQRHEGRGPEAVDEPAVVVLPDRGASRVGAEPDQRARRRGHLAADRLRQRHLGIQPQVQAQRRAALRGDLRDRRAQALAHRRLVFRLGGVVGGQVAVQRLQLLQQARRLRDLMRPGGAQLPR